MTFEEYTKTEEWNAACFAATSRSRHSMGYFLAVIVIAVLLGALTIPMEFVPTSVAESDPFWKAYNASVLIAAAVGLAVMAVLFLIGKRQASRTLFSLRKGIRLFFAENPVPWGTFADRGELSVGAEWVLSEGGRHPFLTQLRLTGGGKEVVLDVHLFRGTLDSYVPLFLACSLLPFLEEREGRGEQFDTVCLRETLGGKPLDKKRECYLVKKGKMTARGKKFKRTCKKLSAE